MQPEPKRRSCRSFFGWYLVAVMALVSILLSRNGCDQPKYYPEFTPHLPSNYFPDLYSTTAMTNCLKAAPCNSTQLIYKILLSAPGDKNPRATICYCGMIIPAREPNSVLICVMKLVTFGLHMLIQAIDLLLRPASHLANLYCNIF